MLKALLLISTICFSGDLWARCIGFDEGTPILCAKIKFQEKLNEGSDTCLYSMRINAITEAGPSFKKFSRYEEILKRKDLLIVELPVAICNRATPNSQETGVLRAVCNDQVGPLEFFRDLFGFESKRKDVIFGTSLFSQSGGKDIKVTCPEEFLSESH